MTPHDHHHDSALWVLAGVSTGLGAALGDRVVAALVGLAVSVIGQLLLRLLDRYLPPRRRSTPPPPPAA